MWLAQATYNVSPFSIARIGSLESGFEKGWNTNLYFW